MSALSRWLHRRRVQKFNAWLDTRPDIKAKIAETNAQFAASVHGSLTVAEATRRLARLTPRSSSD